MDIQAVIFDMDGVIFDSERIICEQWSRSGKKYNLPGIDEVILRCIGTTYVRTREIFEEAYPAEEGYESYDFYKKELSEEFHRLYDGGRLPLKTGVKELLSYLKENGIKIGLATSTREAIATEELSDCGLLSYFDSVTGGDRVIHSKPAPDVYLLACENIDVEPAKAIAIEDSLNGIRSAFRAGMVPIMVPDILPSDAEMQEKAHIILNNLLEVRDYFIRENVGKSRS